MHYTKTPPNTVRKTILQISKRLFDILISLCIFICFLPILFISALLILTSEGAPILYKSKRMASLNKYITVYKFRTMVVDAAKSEIYRLDERYMRNGYLDIPLDCEVYTPIGRLLERTQIVELLQLYNIFRNEMSIVGNRPLPASNIALLQNLPNWQSRFDSPSGITGISQIIGKYYLEPNKRLELEIMYSSIYNNPEGNIFLCDCIILLKTCALLFTHKYLDYEEGVALLKKYGAITLDSKISNGYLDRTNLK